MCTILTKLNIEHTSVGLAHTRPIKCSVFAPGGGVVGDGIVGAGVVGAGVVGAGQSLAEGRQNIWVKIPRLFP